MQTLLAFAWAFTSMPRLNVLGEQTVVHVASLPGQGMEACVGCAPVDSFANVCSRDVYLILATRRAAISRWMWTSPAASPVASPRGEVEFPPCFNHCRFIHYILSYSYSCLHCGHSVLAGRGIIVLFAGGFTRQAALPPISGACLVFMSVI